MATEKMILPSVKICGLKSKNNREYPLHVLQEAMVLYENHPVYIDHNLNSGNRKYVERVGHINKIEVKEDGLYGTLNINPHHDLAESLWYDFNNNTKKIGISQVVDAEMVGNKVTRINHLRSLDIVNDPATTYSLKEEVDEVAKLRASLEEIKKELAEHKESNNQLLTEIENVKAISGKRPVAIAPTGELPKQENLSDWVNKISRRNK